MILLIANLIGKLMCAMGFHHDGTDAFGGYSPTCLRCGKSSTSDATPTFRGSVMAVCGVFLIFLALITGGRLDDVAVTLTLGGLLFLGGLAVIIWQKP